MFRRVTPSVIRKMAESRSRIDLLFIILISLFEKRGGSGNTKPILDVFRRVRKNCEKRLLASSCLFVSLSIRIGQIRSHWTDFRSI